MKTKAYYAFKGPVDFVNKMNRSDMEVLRKLIQNWSIILPDYYESVKPFKINNTKQGKVLVCYTREEAVKKSFKLIQKEIIDIINFTFGKDFVVNCKINLL